MSKVVVAVRARPLNKRELALKSPCVVEMEGQQTRLLPKLGSSAAEVGADRKFFFDHSFWSCDPSDSHFASQEQVFTDIGGSVLTNAFEGYNACIFAYGQTGSGKSYTMMGPDDDKGIIPRLCQSLFEQIDANTDEHLNFKVQVSYMEIYNEKVRDLLGDVRSKKSLRVREHSVLGPYVEGLTQYAVKDYETIVSLMEEGNKSRTVASTNMNVESSCSHAVFTMVLT
jgi:kinesin family protein 13